MHVVRRVGPRAAIVTVLLVASVPRRLPAQDWPMWRYDDGRTASSPHALPATLALEWTAELPAPAPAWPEDPRLGFDGVDQAIVLGERLFVSSARTDSVRALDVATGNTLWIVHAHGPVRFAPVGIGDRIVFGADDGAIYCVSATTGEVLSRRVVLPSRLVLGNDRLISVYPVRGGPVLHRGRIYFTTGVWPFEGAFFHSVDAADVVAAPISTTPLLDLSPQGYLAARTKRIFIPCGRDRAACADLDGDLHDLTYDSKGYTDWHVSAEGPFVFHGQKAVRRGVQTTWPVTMRRPVIDGSVLYGPATEGRGAGDLLAVDLDHVREVESTNREGKKTKRVVLDPLWRLANEDITHGDTIRALKAMATDDDPEGGYPEWLAEHPLVVALRAGPRLYGHQGRTVFSVELPDQGEAPRASWQIELDAEPASLIAAANRLFVTTADGRLHAFGTSGSDPRHVARGVAPRPTRAEAEIVDRALARGEGDGGFCLAIEPEPAEIDALLEGSKLRVLALVGDPSRAAKLIDDLDARGVYGHRVAVVAHRDQGILDRLPPYVADLIIARSHALPHDDEGLPERIFRLLRPYGGTAVLDLDDALASAFTVWRTLRESDDAAIEIDGDLSILERPGALPGSADWRREFGDEGNSLMSHDALVRAPLGVLWYGGPAGSSELFYNRHNWPPSLAVVEGRLFIQGPGTVAAVDVYTGRLLWRSEIRYGGGGVERTRDLSDVSGDRMGNPIFGTPPAGYHFLVEPDALYLAYPEACLVYDPKTGEKRAEIRLPQEVSDQEWGRIHVHDDLLIVPVLEPADPARAKQRLPHSLWALDRRSGEPRWSRKATNAFPFVALGHGRVYCVDADLEQLYRDKRRGNAVPKAKGGKLLVALGVEDGSERWTLPVDMIPTWLSFSNDAGILIASNSEEILAVHGANGYAVWSKKNAAKGFGGHPENLVHKVILWRDQVIDQRGPGLSYDLLTGADRLVSHPLTDDEVAWEFTKIGHHCNYAIASENLLTFRAASAGYFDLETGGTSRLLGFRSGCRNSLIPANGVLNAPNFAHGCICSYSIYTSLALVHVPENERWTYGAEASPTSRVTRLGLNFGAPGDRRVPGGTMWIGHPDLGGPSPSVPVTTVPAKVATFRLHARQMATPELDWVYASGLRGVERITVRLAPPAEDGGATDDAKAACPPAPHTVRLYFAEPDDIAAGERTFSVRLQGDTVTALVDPILDAGGARRGIVREFPSVSIGDVLTVELVAARGEPILCGVEVERESSPGDSDTAPRADTAPTAGGGAAPPVGGERPRG